MPSSALSVPEYLYTEAGISNFSHLSSQQSPKYNHICVFTILFFFSFSYLEGLGLVAYFPPELFSNHGSHRHLIGLLGRGISPAVWQLPKQDNGNTEGGQISMHRVGSEHTIPLFERTKTFHNSDRAAPVIRVFTINSSKIRFLL